MAQAKPLRRIRYRRLHPVRSARDVQQELVLLRIQPMPLRALLAEVQKLPQRIAELGKRLQPFSGTRLRRRLHAQLYRNTI
jgi:hypothetical protein